jgi:hypothetical protein
MAMDAFDVIALPDEFHEHIAKYDLVHIWGDILWTGDTFEGGCTW